MGVASCCLANGQDVPPDQLAGAQLVVPLPDILVGDPIPSAADIAAMPSAPRRPSICSTGSKERRPSILYLQNHNAENKDDKSTIASDGGGSKIKALSLVQADGPAPAAMFHTSPDDETLKKLKDALSSAGIDTHSWGTDKTKSLDHLWWETFAIRAGVITRNPQTGSLKRITRILKIKLLAEIYGVEHVLQSRFQAMHDGRCIERRQILVKRLCWDESVLSEPTIEFNQGLIDENCSSCESWRSGVKTVLEDRLGLSVDFQEHHLEEDVGSYKFHIEDDCQSGSFPGLPTLYCIHEVKIRVVDTETADVQILGLPTGQEFATTEGDFNCSVQVQSDEGGPAIGSQLNIWAWVRCGPPKAESGPAPKAEAKAKAAPAAPTSEANVIKRVPIPNDSACNIVQLHTKLQALKNGANHPTDTSSRPRRRSLGSDDGAKCPCPILQAVLEGRRTDWAKAKRMSKRIGDADYSLRDFTDDLSAFPEMELYLLEKVDLSSDVRRSISGRTLGDEYQRTVGAFYAVYWLCRLGVDGKEGFSFGVDEDWKTFSIKETEQDSQQLFPAAKRRTFLKDSEWDKFEQLLVDAEILVRKSGKMKVNPDRVLTILALTAVHDIMKIASLLPVVQPEHAGYHDYKAGDTISDHDHALSYVMDHYPKLLPSFNGLSNAEKRSVSFTQCQLQFNQGWFVQGEAPPGAVFRKFKEVLVRDQQSRVQPKDIALYFVHWITDLSGAEPTPLGGCEKFVIKFPLPVLNSFLKSFSYVHQLANKSETHVMEDYLRMRWGEHMPALGPVPDRDSVIAEMRLICMAQMNAQRILDGFHLLGLDDKDVLSTEMSRTGCMGQSFSANLIPQKEQQGPGLLIYYAPAFLQALGNDSPTVRLKILAALYRGARELYPASVSAVAQTVTIRIDTIKGLSVKDIVDVGKEGKTWIMIKQNDLEAVIELSSTSKLNKYIANRQALVILQFQGAHADD